VSHTHANAGAQIITPQLLTWTIT